MSDELRFIDICDIDGRQSGFTVTADGVTVRGNLEHGASFTREEFHLLAKQIMKLDATESRAPRPCSCCRGGCINWVEDDDSASQIETITTDQGDVVELACEVCGGELGTLGPGTYRCRDCGFTFGRST